MIPVDPHGLPAGARDDAEARAGIGRAGAGIAEFDRLAGRVPGVGDEVPLDAGAVGVLIDELAAVRRPPQAVAAIEFFCRGEFGQAVRVVSVPPVVSCVSWPVARSMTCRSLSRTAARAEPSGERRGAIQPLSGTGFVSPDGQAIVER